MTLKILKWEIRIIWALAAMNMIAIYFGESFPDHYFSISSNVASSSTLSFWFFSALSFVEFWSGFWVVASAIAFSVFYFFIYRKRRLLLDVFNLLFITAIVFGLSVKFYPSFVGMGLYQHIKSINIDYFLIAASLFTLVFMVSLLGWSLNNSLYLMQETGLSLIDLSKRVIRVTARVLAMVKKATNKINITNRVNSTLRKPQTESYQNAACESAVTQDDDLFSNLEPTGEEFSKSMDHATQTEMSVEKTSPPSAPPSAPAKALRKKPKDFFKTSTLIDCLDRGEQISTRNPESKYFNTITAKIEEKIGEFNIAGKIIDILKGPVVDTFELELGPGVKVSKINSISEDLSLALKGAPIRIVHPMPGRHTIGIEVPRNPREIIFMDEALRSPTYTKTSHRLPITMGKDAFGNVTVVDLASMPHMLVAGATGAGKSVFINTLLVSLLIKLSPEQMKLILIDPKQLELALYRELPHLMMPVLTDSKSSSLALLWGIQEMERRYSILTKLGVRNVERFNEKVKTASPHQLAKIAEHYEDVDTYELPYLVIVVDEFADLIKTKNGKEIETNIARLAGKARAAGIHLVIATQRPSVDVITGLIKANFPTRVSFRVSAPQDSRTILNKKGAEKLLGKGDMLYSHGAEMKRLHSAFVSEDEIEILVDKLSNIEQKYNPQAMEFIENEGESDDGLGVPGSYNVAGNSKDDLYQEAVDLVMETRSASASMLQRRFSIGYNRAANLIEDMEANGIVSAPNNAKRREVLATSDPASGK